jgi:hypothetical protein
MDERYPCFISNLYTGEDLQGPPVIYIIILYKYFLTGFDSSLSNTLAKVFVKWTVSVHDQLRPFADIINNPSKHRAPPHGRDLAYFNFKVRQMSLESSQRIFPILN